MLISSALGLPSIQSRERELFIRKLTVWKTCSLRVHAPYGRVLHFGQLKEAEYGRSKSNYGSQRDTNLGRSSWRASGESQKDGRRGGLWRAARRLSWKLRRRDARNNRLE